MTYDTKCDELARAFLADYDLAKDEPLVAALAQAIQTTIEDFLNEHGMPA